MKLFLLVFFVGCASAFSENAFKRATDDVIESFITGMSNAPSLHEALGVENNAEVLRFERDIKEELAKYLRETFDAALQKIKDAVSKGKEVHKEALERLKNLKEKMKDLNITDDDIGKKLLDELKEVVKGKLKELLSKLGIFGDEKRSVIMESEDSIFSDLNFRNLIIRLKKLVLEKMNVNAVKASIGKFVEKGAERLCSWLSSKGKEKVIGFFDRLFDDEEDEEVDKKKKRSISDLYDQLKDYFDGLDLDLKQKFSRFGEWVKEVLSKGLEKSKDRIENVKTIARKLIEKSKVLSKDVAIQAKEYLKDYKEELGDLYEHVMEILMKKITEYTD